MINLNLPYEENIKKYPQYAKFVDCIMRQEAIEDKYLMMVNSDEIVKIVLLSINKIDGMWKEIKENINSKRKQEERAVYNEFKQKCMDISLNASYDKNTAFKLKNELHRIFQSNKNAINKSYKENNLFDNKILPLLNGVGKVARSLDHKTIFDIMKFVGIDILTNLELDEIDSFNEALKIEASKLKSVKPQKPIQHPNPQAQFYNINHAK